MQVQYNKAPGTVISLKSQDTDFNKKNKKIKETINFDMFMWYFLSHVQVDCTNKIVIHVVQMYLVRKIKMSNLFSNMAC